MDEAMETPVSVKVKGVYIAEAMGGSPAPLVLLEDDQARIVPIFVGLSEAISIHQALTGETSARPMTHDLFVSAMESLNAAITNVLIDDLDGGIYYARLSLRSGERDCEIDARPSDCLALALRAKAPISIQERVVEESKIEKGDVENLRDLAEYLG